MSAIKETINDLHEFVVTQAAEDAEMPEEERDYQASVVKDVLQTEPFKRSVINGLLREYSQGVASHLSKVA